MTPPPEKNKKVSRACNTCRLKRKKCDGLEPCIFCTESKLECSYSREPRRRGPPSGYLRFTETRVALLETLLGLYVQTSAPQTAQLLHDAAQRLTAESKNHTTQDVWDAYKLNWTDSDASRAIHDLAMVFAPFSPTENQPVPSKALLPLPQSGQPPQQPGRQQERRSPSPFSPAVALYTNESFERSVMPSDISPIAERYEEVHDTFERTNDSSGSKELPPINTHSQVVDFNLGMLMARPLFPPPPPDDPPPPSSLYPTTVTAPSSSVLPDADVDPSASQYPGAYWHTAALTSPTPVFAALPPTALAGLASLSSVSAPPPSTDLPPPHVRATLLETYLSVVHPALPILSSAQCGSLTTLEASPMLLLALCAYTARLAPPAVPTRVAADLWYESASALLSSALRRTVVQPDAVQTLLFLALRDHGRARESLAWRGVGAAIRIAVELGLDGGGSTSESASEARLDVNEETWKRCLWGVASMLDLFLSIQFNRAPACAEALRPLPPSPFPLSALGTVGAGVNAGLPSPTSSPTSTTSVQPTSILLSASTDNTQATQASECADNTAAAELAAHTRALVRIVARVHFCVALGYGTVVPSPSGSTTPATALRAELAAWHRGLPQRFRVALGGERVPRAVLEVHMLYQVAVGMLARGSSSANSNPTSGAASRLTGVGGSTVNSASDIDAETDDVASTFNVLLDKYRPSLPLASPPIVWLVFAAARAGLQRAAAAKSSMSSSGVSSSSGTARALQTQLYLLNCREALASMGGTWELARRCARTLEHLMEGDGGPSRPRSDAGKRKRADREGDVGADERGEAEGGSGSGGKRLREESSVWTQQFDFDVSALGWGAEMDELWGADASGNAGLWDTSVWDESLWGRSVLGATGRAGDSLASGSGLGLFDPSPGG